MSKSPVSGVSNLVMQSISRLFVIVFILVIRVDTDNLLYLRFSGSTLNVQKSKTEFYLNMLDSLLLEATVLVFFFKCT